MLKILVLTNLYPPQVLGGYERSIADFARLLQHRGHSVLVLTTGDKQVFSGDHTSCSYTDPQVERCFSLAGQWTIDRGTVWLPDEKIADVDSNNQQQLEHHLQTFQPDVCLAGNLDFLNIVLVERLLTAGIPVAHYVMNGHPGYLPDLAPRSPHYRYLTCSDWVIGSLQQGGYPVETAKTVYPGAAVEEFFQPQLPPRDVLRIAYASLVMTYKGADVLLEALCLLHALGIEFSATIAGGTLTPPFVQALQDLVLSEGMDDRVVFAGVLSRQELSQLYKTHNVLVFPSRFQEPFGISQIEAMAAGLTLVTSGTGGAREIVNHGYDGLLFESENPIDLAEALSFLVANPEQWAAIAHNGQQKALNQFSQAKAVEVLETVLQELVDLQKITEK